MSSPVDTAAIRALLARSTGDEWFLPFTPRDPASSLVYSVDDGGSSVVTDKMNSRADAELICAMRNALPALLDEFDRLRAVARKLARLARHYAWEHTQEMPGDEAYPCITCQRAEQAWQELESLGGDHE